MNFEERPLVFDCGGNRLLGVVACPPAPCELAVVIVVGGPQYRVGSHRQFVQLSRYLAAEGFPVMRFDYTGMGDGEGDKKAFDEIDSDIRSAIDALKREMPSVTAVALWGLCDGASAAAIYLRRDPRVAGAVLVNPWVRNNAIQARTQLKHYYAKRLLESAFWKKLLARRVAIGSSLRDFAASVTRATSSALAPDHDDLQGSFRHRMEQGLHGYRGRVLLMLSGFDLVAREFADYTAQDPLWREILGCVGVERMDLVEADHTFSRSDWKRAAEEATLAWLQKLRASLPTNPRPQAASLR